MDCAVVFVIGVTVVPDGSELVGGGVGGEPLLDGEQLLSAGLVDPSGGDLNVVDVPAVAGAGAVGGEVHGADGGGQTGDSAAEDVEIPPLEVVVSGAHQPAPRLQIVDPDSISVRVVHSQADDRISPSLYDRSRSHVHRGHTVRIVLHFFLFSIIDLIIPHNSSFYNLHCWIQKFESNIGSFDC